MNGSPPSVSRLNSLSNTLSIRAKYIAAFLIVSILSIMVVTLVALPVVQNGLTQQIGTVLHNSAQAEGRAIGDILVRQVDRLLTFSLGTAMVTTLVERNAEYPPDAAAVQSRLADRDQQWQKAGDQDALIMSYLDNPAARRLMDYQVAFPEHVEVFVTDRFGGLVAATQRPSDFYQADEAWWQAAWNNGQGAIHMGQPAWDESSRTFAMIIAVPVRDSTGQVIGILRSTYRLADVVKSVEAARWGTTGRAKVVLPNGQYLTNGTEVASIEADMLRRVPAQGAVSTPYQGIARLISRAPVVATTAEAVVTELGWLILLHQDQQESLRPVNDTIRTSLLAALGALLVTGGLALIFAQQISKPLVVLSGAVDRFAKGDYSQRVVLRRGDELGILSQRFNHMATTIAAQTEGLRAEVARADAARREADAARTEIAAQLQTIGQQQTLLREMSVPILPLTAGTWVMPLIGVIDQQRMVQLQEQALGTLERSAAHYLIIDVTGVPVIDAPVSLGLVQIVYAARLLGTATILVGIRPEVAETLVNSGTDLSGFEIHSSLQSAVTAVLRPIIST